MGISLVLAVAVFTLSIGVATALTHDLALRAQVGRRVALAAAALTPLCVMAEPWFVRTAVSSVSGAVGAGTLAIVIGFGVGVACLVVPRTSGGRALVMGLALAAAMLFAVRAVPQYRADAAAYARDIARVRVHQARLGRYIHDHLPAARVLAADACAVATFAERAMMSAEGASAAERFEWLERQVASDQRPTHVVMPAGWLGTRALEGPLLADGWFGREQMLLAPIDWDHASTAERPFAIREGGNLVDRLDVADTESERAHAWQAPAGGSLVVRDTTRGLALDGGRTITGPATFTLARTPGLPAVLVLRTGGAARTDAHEALRAPARLVISIDGRPAGTLDVPAPFGPLHEVAVTLRGGPAAPTSTMRVTIETSAPYRAFHWFVLAP